MKQIAVWNLPGDDTVQITYIDKTVESFRQQEPDAENVLFIDDIDLPGDIFSPWRFSWRIKNNAVKIDIEVARDLLRQRLREDRAPLLQKADHSVWKLEDAGSDTTAARKHRQKLRDITANPRIDAARSIADLEALTIEALLR